MNNYELELCSLVENIPNRKDYIFEKKFDGYRIYAEKINNKVTLYTRNHIDYTSKLPAIQKALIDLKIKDVVFDGEVIKENNQGKSDFKALQDSLKSKDTENLKYVIFDILSVNKKDLREKTLEERRVFLTEALISNKKKNICISKLYKNGIKLFEEAVLKNYEGIIAKRKDSIYKGGRNKLWLKIKVNKRQEFVIIGYTKTLKKENGISSLLLGYYEKEELIPCGRVGTGFKEKEAVELEKQLIKLKLKIDCKTKKTLVSANEQIILVKPVLVCEVKFLEWTPANALRHPSFLGLRLDKRPKEIKKELINDE